MTGPTHRQYSIAFVCISTMILYSNNILTIKFDTNSINYFLALLIMLPISKIGAKFPDVDHDWDKVGEKTVPNKIINIIIHATGGEHRSWQTHSIDIVAVCTILSLIIPQTLIDIKYVSLVNGRFLYIIGTAFMSGWVSHIFSDMLNGAGVKLFCWGRWRAAFVPKKFFRWHFKTGEAWEAFNYHVVKIINKFLGVITILYPWIEVSVRLVISSFVSRIAQM